MKAHDTEAAVRELAPHLAADGVVVSAQNGLNELVIAEVVGDGAHDRLLRQFRRRLPRARAASCAATAARWWSASSTAASRRASRRCTRSAALFEPDAVLTDNIWGYLWGKLAYGALLFATALTNESIADALAVRAPPPGLPRSAGR